MHLSPVLERAHRFRLWARTRQLLLVTLAGAALLLAIAFVDWVSAAARRNDIQFLVQVGGLIFLVVYVIATNRIAHSSQIAARAADDSARAGLQAVEAATQSLRISEALLAEARATRIAQETQAAPHVVVYADMERLIRYLVIENTGLGFADEVTVNFRPPLAYNTFPDGFMPNFFTGATFTLKPGQVIRQPLSQHYRSVVNFTTGETQTAIVRYRGVTLTEEVEKNYPINLAGFDNLLVTQTDMEVALERLSKLATAVEQTGEAVKSVTRRFDESIPISTVVLSAGAGEGNVAAKVMFHRFVRGLSSEWLTWSERKDSHHYMHPVIKRRLQQLLEAASGVAASIHMTDADANRVNRLLFDIRAALTYPYPDRETEIEDSITHALAELSQIAVSWQSSSDIA